MQPTMTTDNHGNIQYKLNGKLHREDGPAVIFADGTQSWCLNDKLHRLDGPAIIRANGTQWWYINDKKYNFNDYCKKLNLSEEGIMFLKLKYDTSRLS